MSPILLLTSCMSLYYIFMFSSVIVQNACHVQQEYPDTPQYRPAAVQANPQPAGVKMPQKVQDMARAGQRLPAVSHVTRAWGTGASHSYKALQAPPPRDFPTSTAPKRLSIFLVALLEESFILDRNIVMVSMAFPIVTCLVFNTLNLASSLAPNWQSSLARQELLPGWSQMFPLQGGCLDLSGHLECFQEHCVPVVLSHELGLFQRELLGRGGQQPRREEQGRGQSSWELVVVWLFLLE